MDKAHILVTVNLDPVPGAFHTTEKVHDYFTHLMERSIPHYEPVVELVGPVTLTEDQREELVRWLMKLQTMISRIAMGHDDPTKSRTFNDCVDEILAIINQEA